MGPRRERAGCAPALIVVTLAASVVAAGLFVVAAVEDMIKEAHEADDDSSVSTLALIGGFALFGVVSSLLA